MAKVREVARLLNMGRKFGFDATGALQSAMSWSLFGNRPWFSDFAISVRPLNA